MTADRPRLRAARSSRRPRRRGVVTLEFLVGVLILTLLTLAIVEYGVLMLCRHTFAQAATLSAREAAKKGTAPAANAAAIATLNELLALHQLQVIDGDDESDVRVILEYGATMLETGDPDLAGVSIPPGTPIGAQDVRVTLFIDLTAGPLINALAAFGDQFDSSGKVIRLTAVVPME